jgi:hypothetical protein
MLFLSPVLLADYSGISVSAVDAVDKAVISESTGEDWLSGWTYRKSHAINGLAGAGPDYQIRIIVKYSSGVDMGEVVYCDNLCKPDFSDIRFTDDDGLSNLDYWLEEFHDSENATFWVEVADNLDTDQTIFVYFGNAMAISNSNGEDTFIFFDDFDDGSLDIDKWNSFETWTETGGLASLSLTGTGSSIDVPVLRTDNEWDMRNKSLAARWQFDVNSVNGQWGMSCKDGAGMLSYFIGSTETATKSDTYFDLDHSGSDYDHDVDVINPWPDDTFFRTEFSSTPNGTTKNEWFLDHESVSVYNSNSFTGGFQRILLGFYAVGSYTFIVGNIKMDFDWVYLRNQVGLEPVHGAWGALESEPEDGLNWLSGWEFRKAHHLEGSSGAGNNYQVEIVVHQDDGVDSGSEIYSNGFCQPDFDDIRFSDNDGITLLDHWLESLYEFENATFWVEVKDSLDYDQKLYIYYGNPDVDSDSDGESTFIFFDDYENNNLDRWDGTTGAGYSCATDQVVHGTYALKFDATPGADIFKNLTEIGDPLTHDFMVHSWVRDDNQLRGGHVPLVKSQSQFWVYACRGYNSQFSYFQGGADYVHWPYNYTGGSDIWFEMNVGLSMSTDAIHAWKSDYYMGEIGLVASTGVSVPDDLFQIGFGQQSAYVTWWDDTYVRKWVKNEPAHGLWGVLESALSVDSPADVTYEAGTTGHSVEWSAFSYYPHFFHIYLDGTTTSVSTWDGTNIDQSVDGLDPGSYNLTLQINNTFGYSLIDSVTVIVEDTTDPILSHPDDVEYTEGDQGNDITWTLNDLYPDGYQIHLDDELLQAGAWNSTGESLTLSVDSFSAGIYNVSISAVDESGNSAVDYVTVTVQSSFPVMIIIMAGGVVVVVIIGAVVCRMKKP